MGAVILGWLLAPVVIVGLLVQVVRLGPAADAPGRLGDPEGDDCNRLASPRNGSARPARESDNPRFR